MASDHAVRIGIDVGGTFTHAVAVDATTLEIAGKSKVPTTHRSDKGVAEGIIQSLELLLKESQIRPESVRFIAHSTTQATNALLEGDLAPVGILGMGQGVGAVLSRMATDIATIELAPGRFLKTYFEFVDTSAPLASVTLSFAIKSLIEMGAKAIAISEAFSVDSPANELMALDLAKELGVPATCGSQVSKLYGLKVRTRTAVINAAMLPKMIETANLTEESVRAAGIKAPIMIMRSDGGVMDIDAMRQKPIQTMLSGPAAGVAAAMMYLNISDGIFLEVGGTSTDISVIRNGKALIKGAEIGGFTVYMRTLDVRTVGVAGGSMFRIESGKIKDVGPRSAHIAGLGYASFNEPAANPHVLTIAPKAGDPDDYLAIKDGDNGPARLCLTPTCAANYLGLVPKADCASGNQEAIAKAFDACARFLQSSARELAEAALSKAFARCQPVIQAFFKDYKLDQQTVKLVGGGGGAAALVPFFAGQLKTEFSLAENADVISAIGVALALMRETIERNIMNPKEDDILRIREEAFAAVQKMGADPGSIDVHVEVDSRANIVRATAFGAAELNRNVQEQKNISEELRLDLAAKSMKIGKERLSVLAKTPYFEVYGGETVERKLFGLLPLRRLSLRTLDQKGVIRLQTRNGVVRSTKAADADKVIVQMAEEHAHYGDAGKIIPDIMLLAGPRIIDLSGLPDSGQIAVLARAELQSMPADAPAIVIASLG
jgi:N-methylhydantoinase A/oxoprolinase/acetone carboxylase beta subunit